jgi:hypothetical protein
MEIRPPVTLRAIVEKRRTSYSQVYILLPEASTSKRGPKRRCLPTLRASAKARRSLGTLNHRRPPTLTLAHPRMRRHCAPGHTLSSVTARAAWHDLQPSLADQHRTLRWALVGCLGDCPLLFYVNPIASAIGYPAKWSSQTRRCSNSCTAPMRPQPTQPIGIATRWNARRPSVVRVV